MQGGQSGFGIQGSVNETAPPSSRSLTPASCVSAERRRSTAPQFTAGSAGGTRAAHAGPGAARRRRPRAVQDARDPRRHSHRWHRRAAGRPGRHRRRGNRIQSVRSAGHARPAAAREPRAAERRPRGRRDRHVRAAGIREPARACRRRAEESGRGVSLQALARARHHDRARRAADGSRAHRQRARAQQPQRDRRAAPRQLPAPGRGMGQGAGRHAGGRARVGALGRGERSRGPEARRAAAGHHGGAARRSEEAQPRLDRAPAADRRRADERADRREARPADGHPLLRPLRSAAEGLRRPAVAGRSDQRRRADAIRSGGAAVGQDPPAGQPRVEGVSRGAPEARTRRSIRR